MVSEKLYRNTLNGYFVLLSLAILWFWDKNNTALPGDLRNYTLSYMSENQFVKAVRVVSLRNFG